MGHATAGIRRVGGDSANLRAGVTVAGNGPSPAAVVAGDDIPKDLSVGRLLVIRGTEISFYIPPTGVDSNYTDGAVPDAPAYYRIRIQH